MSNQTNPPSPHTHWPAFFDAHAPFYDQNPFTQHTVAEVDFLLQLYPVSPGASFLDVGCGTGRHALELARRGYKVTGVDLSEGMLKVAREKAAEEGLEVEFIHADAKTFALDKAFDYAVCLCEGGLGLLDAGEDAERHDKAIFERVHAHLKPNAPFICTVLNAYNLVRRLKDENIGNGTFNPVTMTSYYDDEFDLPEGKQTVRIYERLFFPPEVIRMLRESGFTVDKVFGGTAGYWAQRPLSLDEMEAMYCARRA